MDVDQTYEITHCVCGGMVGYGSKCLYATVIVQSCVKTFLIRFENHFQNVPLPTPKWNHCTTFQPFIPKTWQECLYTTLSPKVPMRLLSGMCRFKKKVDTNETKKVHLQFFPGEILKIILFCTELALLS